MGSNTMLRAFAIFLFAAAVLGACKPNDAPPPDILKSQRESLEKARAVQGQLQEAQERRQQAEDDQTK